MMTIVADALSRKQKMRSPSTSQDCLVPYCFIRVPQKVPYFIKGAITLSLTKTVKYVPTAHNENDTYKKMNLRFKLIKGDYAGLFLRFSNKENFNSVSDP